jgi:hypothetical protein
MIINGLLEATSSPVFTIRIDRSKSASGKLQLYGMNLGGSSLNVYMVIGGTSTLIFTTTSNSNVGLPVYGNCDQIRIEAPASAVLSFSYVNPEEE